MATVHAPTDLVRDLRASAAAAAASASDLPDGFGGAMDFLSDMEQAQAQTEAATSAEADLGILHEEDEQDNEDDEDVNAEDGDLCEEVELASASVPAVRFDVPALSLAAATGPAPTLIPSLSSSMQRRSSMPSSTAAGNAAVDSATVLPLQKVAAGGAKRVIKKEKTKDSKATASTTSAPVAAKKGVPATTQARSLRGQSVYIAKPAAVKRGPSAREIGQERAGILLTKTASTSSLHAAEEPLSARGKENPAANGGDVSARRTGVVTFSRYMKSSSCATTNSHVIEKTVHQPPQPLTARTHAAAAAAAHVSSASGAATARRSSMTDFPSVVAARPTTHAGKRRSAAMDHASVVPATADAVVESDEGSASKKARHDGLELMARAPFCSPVAESPAASINANPQASPEVSALISRKLSFAEGEDADAAEVKMADAGPVVLHFAHTMEPVVAAAAAAAVATAELSSEERDQFVSALAAKDAELASLRTELAASVARASELDRDNCSTRALLTEAWESEEKYKSLYRDLDAKHATMSAALESAKSDAASSLKKYEVIRTQHDKLQHTKHVLIKRVEMLEKAAAASSGGAAGDWDSAANFNFDTAAAASAAAAGVETRRATMAHHSVTHSATGLLSKRK